MSTPLEQLTQLQDRATRVNEEKIRKEQEVQSLQKQLTDLQAELSALGPYTFVNLPDAIKGLTEQINQETQTVETAIVEAEKSLGLSTQTQ